MNDVNFENICDRISIPDHRVHCEKFVLFVVYGFTGSGEFQASGGKKGFWWNFHNIFFNAAKDKSTILWASGPTLPFLLFHEPKENNRRAEAFTLSMGTCGSTTVNNLGSYGTWYLRPSRCGTPYSDYSREGNATSSQSEGAVRGDRHCLLR